MHKDDFISKMTSLANNFKMLKEETFNKLVSTTLIEQYEEKLKYLEVVLTTDQKHDMEYTLQGTRYFTHFISYYEIYDFQMQIKGLIF